MTVDSILHMYVFTIFTYVGMYLRTYIQKWINFITVLMFPFFLMCHNHTHSRPFHSLASLSLVELVVLFFESPFVTHLHQLQNKVTQSHTRHVLSQGIKHQFNTMDQVHAQLVKFRSKLDTVPVLVKAEVRMRIRNGCLEFPLDFTL